MNVKLVALAKNFSYTISSNVLSLVISALVILVVPKLIGVEAYGYWQLYLFYSSYVVLLHFGWNDGIYLRYGGKEYMELNKQLFFSQFWMLFFLQCLLGAVITFILAAFITDGNRLLILEYALFCMLIVNARYMLMYILQGTNRIKENAQITIMEKVLYCGIIGFFLLAGMRNYILLIIADLAGKLISFLYSIYCCRDIVLNKISAFRFSFRETLLNVSVGIKLLVSNIATLLIIGVVRFGIERTWGVATFGKISIVISVSGLLMVFIDALGIILFPVLRRTNEDKLSTIYTAMRTFLIVPMIGVLMVYYPLRVILSAWLPQFAESFMYMALLFPACVYEGKMALLINTYLKTLRKEKMLLAINLASVIFSFVLTILFTLVFKNLSLSVVSIGVILMFRCVLAEVLLSKILNISLYKDTILEMGMSLIFILSGWFGISWLNAALFLLSYGVYLLMKRTDIQSMAKNVKLLLRESSN